MAAAQQEACSLSGMSDTVQALSMFTIGRGDASCLKLHVICVQELWSAILLCLAPMI